MRFLTCVVPGEIPPESININVYFKSDGTPFVDLEIQVLS